jgi:hypothetical protein
MASEVVKLIATILQRKPDKQFDRSTGGPIMFSIELTFLWLVRACSTIYRGVAGSGVHLLVGICTSASFLEEKMLAEGWCPSLMNKLKSLGDQSFNTFPILTAHPIENQSIIQDIAPFYAADLRSMKLLSGETHQRRMRVRLA